MAQSNQKAQIATRFVDQQTFRSLVQISSLVEIFGLVVALTIQLFMPKLQLPANYSIPAVILLAIGLGYNAFIWKNLHDQRPQLALQIAMLPPILAIQIAAAGTGGVNSPWYSLWLVAIVCSGIAGTIAVYVAAFFTTTFWIYSAIWHPGGFQITANPLQIFTTIIALVAAYFIGRMVNRMVKTMQIAESLTNQLDSAELKDQLMMSAIADAVVAVDTDRKVVIFNEAAQSLTGWDLKSAVGVEYNLIFKLKDQNDAELTVDTDPFLQVMKEGTGKVTDNFFMLNKDNQKISFSISIAPTFDGKHAVNGAIGVFHDISDQKSLARERNEFISTASHEMRTPVAAIEGYLSMAMNPALSTIDDRAKTFINKAHDASLHLGKLFKDLLSVTKIEDNRIIINRRKFNLSELVNQIVSEMEVISRQKNIKILTHFGGTGMAREMVVAPAFEVNANPDRIREVIANLIDNAIKYSKEGTIDVTLKADHNFVTFSVADTGIGISPEDQKHLFQKFYRVNNSFTREIGGTGLGLYIARNLVEKFGGKIWIESAEGKGSTFYFTLPLDKAA